MTQAVQRLRDAGAVADGQLVDLAEPKQVSEFQGPLAAETVDILVSNTGGPAPGPIGDVTGDQWIVAFRSMVSSIFAITAAALPGMRARKWGRIINIVSSGIIQPIPNLGVSNALRASIVGWAKTPACETTGNGITVNSVVPGRIQTERVEELHKAAAGRSQTTIEEVAAQSRATIPAARYGTPQEFADVVRYFGQHAGKLRHL